MLQSLKESSDIKKLYSCQIGETARRLLTPGACGQVLAGFSRAAYLVMEQAGLFWLASENAPMHLRAVRIAGPFPKLVAGENFVMEGECIKITPDLQVDLGDASTWAFSPIPAKTALEIDQIPIRVKSIFPRSFDLSQASGFGRLIPKILWLAEGQMDDEAEIDPTLAVAWPSIHEIIKACLLDDMPGLFREAKALVGLGEGLTPSGDDFLGGLLFCLNTIQRLYPGFMNLNSSEQALFIESAKQRTNLISFALLKDSANGQAVEPLHELIQSVFSEKPPESSRAAFRLTQIGYSTGWDLLTGALTGLLSTFPSPDSIDSPAILPTQDIYF